jgi:hypothetical protein
MKKQTGSKVQLKNTEKCGFCGLYFRKKTMLYKIDPFLEDVHGKIVRKYWCSQDCLELCAWEI